MISAAQAAAATREPAPAATAKAGSRTADAGARRPFATLMDGMLKGTQPAAGSAATTASRQAGSTARTTATGSADDHDAGRADPDGQTATTGTATATATGTNPAAGLTAAAALDGAATIPADPADGDVSGNPLPGSGKALPAPNGGPAATHGTAAGNATGGGVVTGNHALLAEVAEARALAQSMTDSTAGTTGRTGAPHAGSGATATAVPGASTNQVGPLAGSGTGSGAGSGAGPGAGGAAGAPVPTALQAQATTRATAEAAASFANGTTAVPTAPTDLQPADMVRGLSAGGTSTVAGGANGTDGTSMESLAGELRHGTAPGGSATSTSAAGTDSSGRLMAAFAAGHAGTATPGTDTTTTATAGTLGGAAGGSATSSGVLQASPLPAALQPLGSAGAFASGLADRLLAMAGPGTQSARLKLHPDHLGALQVEIRITDGSAQVWFGATSDQARHAIQASLPQLRQLFADQGIQLTRTHVDAGNAGTSFGQGTTHDQGYGQGPAYDQDFGQARRGNAAWIDDRQASTRSSRANGWPAALPGLAVMAGSRPGFHGSMVGRVDVRV